MLLTSEDSFLLESFRQEVGNIYLSLRANRSSAGQYSDSFKSYINYSKGDSDNDKFITNTDDLGIDSDWHSLQYFCPDLLYEHIRYTILKESQGKIRANNQHDEHDTGAPQILCNYFFGVCMIADISGFTNLSSSLCKKGKSGLDKLHLNTKGFIGQLVNMVYYYGGDG